MTVEHEIEKETTTKTERAKKEKGWEEKDQGSPNESYHDQGNHTKIKRKDTSSQANRNN